MSGFQQLIIEGYLGSDPERRVFSDGITSYVNFPVCVNERIQEKEKQLWVQVTAWQRLGDACLAHLQIGSHVMVIGKLKADEHGKPVVYRNLDGSTQTSFQMTAEMVRFLDRKEAVDECIRQ